MTDNPPPDPAAPNGELDRSPTTDVPAFDVPGPDDRLDIVLAARVGRGPVSADQWDSPTRYAELVQRLRSGGTWPDSRETAEAPDTRHGRNVGRPPLWRAGERSSWRVLAAGAGLMAAAALMIGTFRMMHTGASREIAPSTAHVYATQVGQRATITLAEGGRVHLAPGTTLRVAGDRRDGMPLVIDLTGEAYFEVASRANAPVFVRTGKVQTRILGTAFVVRHYTSDATTRVAVVTGKVEVGAIDPRDHGARPPSVVLSAGMVGSATDSTASAALVSDIKPFTSWVDGTLVFRDAPVPEVLATLGRWYGFTFRLQDSTLMRRHLSATFDYQKTADMFAALKTLLDVRIAFDTSTVTLYPRVRTTDRNATREPLIHTMMEVGR